MLPQTFKEIPYDLYCPSVQSVLKDRMCLECNLHFASLVLLRSHSVQHKKVNPVPPKRIIPLRIAAVRQRELMAVIANVENGESADWFDESELDLTAISIPNEDVGNMFDGFPVISLKSHFDSPWEDE